MSIRLHYPIAVTCSAFLANVNVPFGKVLLHYGIQPSSWGSGCRSSGYSRVFNEFSCYLWFIGVEALATLIRIEGAKAMRSESAAQ